MVLVVLGLCAASACSALTDDDADPDPTRTPSSASGRLSSEPGPSPDITQVLRSGTWAGEHALFRFTARGATAEFDCASGAITEPVRLDAQQEFAAAGWYRRDPGGPADVSATPEPGTPATYHGARSGSHLEVLIELDNGASYGPFQLTLGAEPALVRCL